MGFNDTRHHIQLPEFGKSLMAPSVKVHRLDNIHSRIRGILYRQREIEMFFPPMASSLHADLLPDVNKTGYSRSPDRNACRSLYKFE
jgi:hypothetical protein